MRFKFISALSIVIAFSVLFSSQLINLASAHSTNNNTPITNPVTNPITTPVTGPVTGPITSPVSIFRISGQIAYHILGIFKKSAERFYPASGVTVKVKDIFNGHSATAVTDSNGNYVVDAGQAGFYNITVSGGKARFYTPPVAFVQLTKKNPEKKHLNFQGIILKF